MTAPFVPMTKEDVAAVLMCTTRTVENLVKSSGIPTPTLLAGRVFWHPDVFIHGLIVRCVAAQANVVMMAMPSPTWIRSLNGQ
jgi:hypothetical protein